jgi:hypothetical protein
MPDKTLCIVISTVREPRLCASCGADSRLLAYRFDGSGLIEHGAAGMSSSGYVTTSIRLSVWLCNSCVDRIGKEKRLILTGQCVALGQGKNEKDGTSYIGGN